jgi:hypothetical protein
MRASQQERWQSCKGLPLSGRKDITLRAKIPQISTCTCKSRFAVRSYRLTLARQGMPAIFLDQCGKIQREHSKTQFV